ncbi:MAG: NAD(P)(+) transhydrogenase (Re/Si-specific) subunit alpha, partial [bacterium]
MTAGKKASFPDSAYIEVGAKVLADEDLVIAEADIITKVRPPAEKEVPKLAGKTLIGLVSPALNPDLYSALTSHKVTTF